MGWQGVAGTEGVGNAGGVMASVCELEVGVERLRQRLS